MQAGPSTCPGPRVGHAALPRLSWLSVLFLGSNAKARGQHTLVGLLTYLGEVSRRALLLSLVLYV